MRLYKTPGVVRTLYAEAHFSMPDQSGVYLTFDDGPDPVVTPWVLDLLEKANAKATFFVIGKHIARNAALVKCAMKAGHSIGNHTFSHLKGWGTTTTTYISDVMHMQDQLDLLGANRKLFRPPYGRVKKKQLSKLADFETFFWSHLSWDFDRKCRPNDSLRNLKDVPPGSIILFHDTQAAFGNLKQILPELISHYQSRNLKLLAL